MTPSHMYPGHHFHQQDMSTLRPISIRTNYRSRPPQNSRDWVPFFSLIQGAGSPTSNHPRKSLWHFFKKYLHVYTNQTSKKRKLHCFKESDKVVPQYENIQMSMYLDISQLVPKTLFAKVYLQIQEILCDGSSIMKCLVIIISIIG